MNELSLAPGLLLAMPQLLDPNFARAVVLMIEHNDEGSFGLIINRPSDMPVAQLLDVLEIPWHGDPEAVVWAGGPVMPTSGWVLHEPTTVTGETATDLHDGLDSSRTVLVSPGLALSTAPETLRELATSPPARTRFLLGYAGWGAGQLASEVARGAWLHADADPAIVFGADPDQMWETAIRSLGVDPENVVPSHGIH